VPHSFRAFLYSKHAFEVNTFVVKLRKHFFVMNRINLLNIMFHKKILFPQLVLIILFSFSTTTFGKAAITLVNLNSAGVGLNDTTPVTPVGGNNGTTLGEQRRNALLYTAELLSVILHSDVTIEIGVSFDNLGGTSTSAPLAEAGPNTYHYDFTNALNELTWFPQPLANKLLGSDLAPASSCISDSRAINFCYDVSASFNSLIDTTSALANSTWYYGFDAPTQTDIAVASQFDLVTVALHELLHGMGLISLIDLSNGDFLFSTAENQFLPDRYSILIGRDGVTPSNLGDMNNAQRLQAIAADGSVFWDGTLAANQASGVQDGTLNGKPLMYTPNPVEQGATLSHLDTSFTPDETLEPFYTIATHDISVAAGMLADMGWGALANLSVSIAPSSNPAPINQSTNYQLAVSNLGAQTAPETAVLYTLPANTSFVSASPAVCTNETTQVSCSLGSLASEQTSTLTLTLAHSATGTLSHSVEVYGNIVDSQPTNNTASLSITASNLIPNLQANAGENTNGIAGESVTIDATGSSIVSGSISDYTFELVNGSGGTITETATGQADVALPSDGSNVVIKVTVEDRDGNSSSDFVTVSVNARPSVEAGEDQTVSSGVSVTLTGTGSDSDGSVASYLWQQTSGTTVTLNSPNDSTTTFTAPSGSTTLVFTLTVTDDQGVTNSDTISVAVNAPASSSGGGTISLAVLVLLLLLQVTYLVSQRQKRTYCSVNS